MATLKYPIGIQSFADLRTNGWAYVDKTRYIYELANQSKHVFLSRPRRFGKSLLLSTFQAYFEGKKELFNGLEIEQLETDWISYPVLRFDFSGSEAQKPAKLQEDINLALRKYEKDYEVDINDEVSSIGTRFGMLIQNVAEKTGKNVVVLIDEYDKGIVEVLQDEQQLEKNTARMRPFFEQLKSRDQYLKFVFLTGVSRFRNLTLFSSPNQLKDISISPKYAAICGLTAEELHTVFAEGIENLSKSQKVTVEEAKHMLKLKYDSYRFTEAEKYVYNPFSILNCLDEGRFSNYWITSGASKVFVDYLKQSDYDLTMIEDIWVTEEILGGPYNLKDPIPLLYQTGYLTITDYNRGRYKLGIPNGEVRTALVDQLAPLYLGIDNRKTNDLLYKLWDLTEDGDANGLLREFQQISSKIPHQMFKLNDVEHVYHLVVMLIAQMAGIHAQSEVSVAGGDIDMVIEASKYVYVIEFKKDHSAEEALRQIDDKGYSIPWSADGRKIFKIGVEFSSSNRNITNWVISE